MKKTAILTAAVLLGISMLSAAVNAAETWRDGFVTRLMSFMTKDPSYTDLVMTDLDSNGIPEIFTVKPGANGHIGAGITMRDNTVVTVTVPQNVTGECLEDITVYEVDGSNVFVGKEISRYSSTIQYYQLVFNGTSLSCVRVNKNQFASYKALPYEDVWDDNFLKNGFPDRTKIRDFVYGYDLPSQITVKKSSANVSVNGSIKEISGYNVNYNNYYKVRDIAMFLRTTPARFDVEWDKSLNAVSITTGVKYTIQGGELSDDNSAGEPQIELNASPIYVDGAQVDLETYNINGSTYFKIRDLADLLGFRVDWNEATQTILLTTN